MSAQDRVALFPREGPCQGESWSWGLETGLDSCPEGSRSCRAGSSAQRPLTASPEAHVAVPLLPQVEEVPSVTESEVQLLAALKSIKGQGWWKGKFALFRRLATWVGQGRCPQATSPPLTVSGQELL